MMSEGMRRLHWEEFLKWLEDNDYSFRLDCISASIREMVTEIQYVRNISEVDHPRVQEKLEVINVNYQ